jgi:hypothetical protein
LALSEIVRDSLIRLPLPIYGPTMILTLCPQDNWASTTLGPEGRTVVMNQILASFSHSSQ